MGTFIPIIRGPVPMLFVVRAVVLVGGSARGAASGARTALAAGTELLADAARCNTHIAHIHTPDRATDRVAME